MRRDTGDVKRETGDGRQETGYRKREKVDGRHETKYRRRETVAHCSCRKKTHRCAPHLYRAMNEPVIIGLRPVSEDREDSPAQGSEAEQEEEKQDQVSSIASQLIPQLFSRFLCNGTVRGGQVNTFVPIKLYSERSKQFHEPS